MYGIPSEHETLEFLHWLSLMESNGVTSDYTQWYPLLYSLGIRCMSDLLLLQNLGPEDTDMLRGLLNVPPRPMRRLQGNVFMRAINALPPRRDA